MSEFLDTEASSYEPLTGSVDDAAEAMALNVFDHAKRFFNGELDRFSATFCADGIHNRANQLFNGMLGLMPDVVRQDLGTGLREWKDGDEDSGIVRAVFSVRTVKFVCASGRTIVAELLGQPGSGTGDEFEPTTIVYKSESAEQMTTEAHAPKTKRLLSRIGL